MIIIDLRCEIYDVRFVICDLEGYDPFVIAECRTSNLSLIIRRVEILSKETNTDFYK